MRDSSSVEGAREGTSKLGASIGLCLTCIMLEFDTILGHGNDVEPLSGRDCNILISATLEVGKDRFVYKDLMICYCQL